MINRQRQLPHHFRSNIDCIELGIGRVMLLAVKVGPASPSTACEVLGSTRSAVRGDRIDPPARGPQIRFGPRQETGKKRPP
jgi:hypothetical protein